ncbi:transposase [Methanobrevibacter sp.]
MVSKKINKNQAELGIRTHDFNVPKNHISRFVVDFIEECFPILGIKENKKNKKKGGRPFYPLCSMLKLLVYAKIDHIESARVIEEMAKYHDIYKFVCDRIRPSERSIQRYRDEFGQYYEVLLQMTLEMAVKKEFTEFNHVSIDGTIVKTHNSNQNMISKKETNLLVKYYKGLEVDAQKLKKLNKPAQKILNNKEMSNNDKLELLYDIQTQFKFTGQNKIPMNDIEARMMKGKKGNYLVAYNVQSAVDYDTKLICALNVTQSPTDHYQLSGVDDKAINNIGKVPKYMSADTIYLNQISLSYFVNKGIDGLIPTRKQSKERTGELHPKPFHKDHFYYIIDMDLFMCPAGQPMYFYKEYTETSTDPDTPDKIKRLYNNYYACKHCIHRDSCLTEKQTDKTITENGGRLKRAMFFKMEKKEYKEEFKKRPCVEEPFGIFKEQFHVKQEIVIGMVKTEQRLNLDALAYNIKRLYNLIQEEENNKEDIVDFCESISATHQLKLDVTIN